MNSINYGFNPCDFMQVYSPQEDSILLQETLLKENFSQKSCLDLGTGSGIQARAMHDTGSRKIISSDINYKALLQSQKNNSEIKQDIKFIESDLFEHIHNKFDVVAFNPPYVPSEEIRWKDLDGGKKGRQLINKFLKEVLDYLNKNGIIFLLISSLNNKEEVINELENKGFLVKIVASEKFFFEELFVLKAILL